MKREGSELNNKQESPDIEIKEGEPWYLPDFVGATHHAVPRGGISCTEQHERSMARAEKILSEWPFPSKPTYTAAYVVHWNSKRRT